MTNTTHTLQQEIRDAAPLVNHNGAAFRNAFISNDCVDARVDALTWALRTLGARAKHGETPTRTTRYRLLVAGLAKSTLQTKASAEELEYSDELARYVFILLFNLLFLPLYLCVKHSKRVGLVPQHKGNKNCKHPATHEDGCVHPKLVADDLRVLHLTCYDNGCHRNTKYLRLNVRKGLVYLPRIFDLCCLGRVSDLVVGKVRDE
jgi:hypothetical protein